MLPYIWGVGLIDVDDCNGETMVKVGDSLQERSSYVYNFECSKHKNTKCLCVYPFKIDSDIQCVLVDLYKKQF